MLSKISKRIFNGIVLTVCARCDTQLVDMPVRLFAVTTANQSVNSMCSGAALPALWEWNARLTEQQCQSVADREAVN